jgi:transglutaminase-like putative cysteine protease
MLCLAPLLLALLPGLPGSDASLGATRTYTVRQTAHLTRIDQGAKEVRWWVSIPDDERFQDVLDLKVVSAPGTWRVEREPSRGNRFLYIEVKDPKAAELEAVVEFTLRRQPVLVDVDPAKVGPITADHRTIFAAEVRQDEPHMAVTKEIAALAAKVCGDEQNPARETWKLLEYVAHETDHYSKDATKPRCGIGDAGECMTNQGGCCTDMHSLFIALARARGIPARLQMGYRVQEKNLGKEVDPGYRCWAEYFLPGYGWVPADIVEADAADGLGPERWFRGLTERRVWLNQGREFVLAPAQAGGPVSTMSMGYAEIDGRPAMQRQEGDTPAQLTRTVLCNELPEPEPKTAMQR